MKPRPARRGRLTRSSEFERVYRQGRSCANRHLVLYSFPNAGSEQPRIGLSVSKRVGGAVERNRVKRMLREGLARVGAEALAGNDVVVVARPDVLELIEQDGLGGVELALRDLVEKASKGQERSSLSRKADAARSARDRPSRREAA